LSCGELKSKNAAFGRYSGVDARCCTVEGIFGKPQERSFGTAKFPFSLKAEASTLSMLDGSTPGGASRVDVDL